MHKQAACYPVDNLHVILQITFWLRQAPTRAGEDEPCGCDEAAAVEDEGRVRADEVNVPDPRVGDPKHLDGVVALLVEVTCSDKHKYNNNS